MDIAAMSVVMQQSKLQESAALLVMKKVMNTANQNGGEIVAMLSESGVPKMAEGHLGGNIDTYI